MKTLGEVYRLSVELLQNKKIEKAKFVVQELMASVLGIDRMSLFMQFDRPLEEKELNKLRSYIFRKAKGEPLEYILGFLEFYHCRLSVTPQVLIPRPETEILLDGVVTDLAQIDLSGKEAWDLCTGSGCLAIGLKKKYPQLEVTGVDLSLEALQVARLNAKDNAVDVSFVYSDMFSALQGRKVDFLLCNPPYITKKEYEALDSSVRDYEPKVALVGGESGLEFYQTLAQELPKHLRAGGKAFFEIGTGQGEAVRNLFASSVWKQKKVGKDWSGHDRFFFLEIE